MKLENHNENFQRILKEHADRYPLMEPQDYGKLLYQSEFGPEHMISDERKVKSFLTEEWKSLPKDSSPRFPESVGEGLCRFPLSACLSADAAELLAELFIVTAREFRGTTDGLKRKLEQAAKTEAPGMKEWITEWERNGYPSVHHSDAYRNAYKPHYRLVKKEYVVFFPALAQIRRLLESETSAIVAIDGRCGSGKTSLAGLIGKLFSCPVVHMDDFYLPFDARQKDWKSAIAGNMDLERFRSEILLPVRAGREAVYRPYCCREGRMGEAVRLQPCPLTVIEGSYSEHPLLTDEYDLKLFLTCSKEEQKERLLKREGSYYAMFEECWIPMEENYFRRCAVESSSHLVIDTGDLH